MKFGSQPVRGMNQGCNSIDIRNLRHDLGHEIGPCSGTCLRICFLAGGSGLHIERHFHLGHP